MIKAIFFDLDNTLYDQASYFASGFDVIAKYLNKNLSLLKEDVIEYLNKRLKAEGSMYTKLFDDLLNFFSVYDEQLVKILVRLFHEAPVDSLVVYDDVRNILPQLAHKHLLGLITNGCAAMQRRKVVALGLSGVLSIQVYTAEIGYPKPNPQGYIAALQSAEVRAGESLYVGDNPYVDFAGARQLGMYTCRLLRGEFKDVNSNENLVDAEVRSFYELELWLHRL